MPANQAMPWYVQPALCVVVIGVFVVALVGSIWRGDQGLFETLCGFAGGAFTAAVSFYFGSSHSSQKKDDTIAQASAALAGSVPAPAPPPATPVNP